MSKGHERVGYGDVTSSKESSSEMKKDNKCSHLHVQKNCEVCEKKENKEETLVNNVSETQFIKCDHCDICVKDNDALKHL